MNARPHLLTIALAATAMLGSASATAFAAGDDPPREARPDGAVAIGLATPGEGETLAQRTPRPTQRAATREPAWSIHGLALFGLTSFTASKTFDAVLGTSSGQVFGGGVRIGHRSGFFGQVDATRFTKSGERVFVSGDQIFKLGIPTEVTVTPLEVTGGFRYIARPRPARPGTARRPPRARPLFIPFVGGGFGQVNYRETADFAKPGDDTDESFRSYHVVGGVDVPIGRWFGVGVDVGRRWVSDAMGQGGVSKEFGETDLGGTTFRLRIVVGR